MFERVFCSFRLFSFLCRFVRFSSSSLFMIPLFLVENSFSFFFLFVNGYLLYILSIELISMSSLFSEREIHLSVRECFYVYRYVFKFYADVNQQAKNLDSHVLENPLRINRETSVDTCCSKLSTFHRSK